MQVSMRKMRETETINPEDYQRLVSEINCAFDDSVQLCTVVLHQADQLYHRNHDDEHLYRGQTANQAFLIISSFQSLLASELVHLAGLEPGAAYILMTSTERSSRT